ncbi:MAG TPA: ATP-dependent chaperone ClpB [Bacteroidales bacterium]|nr:ATP-dependent chaperone ClpB [Bacteroidales bacterium]HSA42505.1 ATP-dependent chaperone ClpB [Bacteroidales bacterium]
MNIQQFTIKSQEAIQKAQEIASGYHHQAIENVHLLKAMLAVDENLVPFLLKKTGVNDRQLSDVLGKTLESMPVAGEGETYISQETARTLQKASKLPADFQDEFVSLEHLLLAILLGEGTASHILKDSGLTEKLLRQAIQDLRKGGHAAGWHAEDNYNALNRYARNLNALARAGKLDPVIGRDEEIRRVLQILSRRTKNNPILIGEPGVGKTAIAEGLAHRIINGDVPENLKSRQLFSLDMGSLIAGAKYKGEFEERLKSVVQEVIAAEGEIMLFIDEIHTLVGAGASEGAMDAANILKPALAKGELRAIGATTLNEYQKYFEKDKALERRFQIVMVDEPDAADAISILRGLKERYETHHQVRIKDEAIISAVELSQRYITDRFLPDKAIDLMDEAAARLRLEMNSLPESLDEIERRIRQLEIEREAFKREQDQVKLDELNATLSNLTEERNGLKMRWEAEKERVNGIQRLKAEIEALKLEAEQAEREGDYGRVAELRYGRIKEKEQQSLELKEALQQLQGDNPMMNEEVGSEEIAGIVSRWTGIPLNRMLQSEREKLLLLEDELHRRVVGQDEAIEAVADAIRRSRAGLQDSKRPVGSFIFLGTTGVGKTELARSLAAFLFNDENAMVRIDMSEYQERHTVSRLIGAPPGYVGYDEGGQLTEKVRRKPYAVVLLDEIEKAHPDVFNILLQVLDEGRLTDNKGRTADFKNTIIIMTSNLGSHIIQESHENGTSLVSPEKFSALRGEVLDLLRKTIRPEFLNRIDEIIMFKPLSRDEVRDIVRMQIASTQEMLAKSDIRISFTADAIDWLAELGYDPQYGARPVKRVFQKKILNELSKMILGGSISKENEITVDMFNQQFVFYHKSS